MAGVSDQIALASTDIDIDAQHVELNANVSSGEVNNRKRRLSTNEQDEKNLQNKKILLSNNGSPANESDSDTSYEFNLIDFSDEILLEILLNCNSLTLHALSKTCTRFQTLVKDRILWTKFDFSRKRLSAKEINKRLKYVSNITKDFSVRGFVSKYPLDKWKNNTITPKMLHELSANCPNLESFAVYDGYINFQKISITDFPKTLKRLILNGCQIPLPRATKIFNKMDAHLKHLEELSLEKCPWFETHDLILFSKLPNLKKLNLRGCLTLKDCVPYGSIATRFGFRKLESLDVRETALSDSDIQCFNITTTLRELLLECPSNLREPVFDDSNKDSTDDEGSNNDDEDDDILNNPLKNSFDSESILSTSEDENNDDDHDDEDEDDDDDNGDDKPDDNAQAEPASGQNHFIHVFVRNGNMENVSNDNSAMRDLSGLRYMVGVLNGTGPSAVLQRQLQEREQDQVAAAAVATVSTNENNIGASSAGPSTSQAPSTSRAVSTTNQNQVPTNSKASTEGASSSIVDGAADSSIPLSAELSDSVVSVKSVAVVGASSSSSSFVSNLPSTAGTSNEANQNTPENVEPQAGSSVASPNNNEPAPSVANEGGNNQNPTRHVHHVIIRQIPQEGENSVYRDRVTSWEIRNRRQAVQSFIRQYNQQYGNDVSTIHNLVSDRGICGFGMARPNVQEGIIYIRAEARSPDTLIERLVIRNYRSVTDVTLRHLALCAPNLQYLDVRGTSVTSHGVRRFRAAKPNCVVVSNLFKKSI